MLQDDPSLGARVQQHADALNRWRRADTIV
jgi:hypothetical protein